MKELIVDAICGVGGMIALIYLICETCGHRPSQSVPPKGLLTKFKEMCHNVSVAGIRCWTEFAEKRFLGIKKDSESLALSNDEHLMEDDMAAKTKTEKAMAHDGLVLASRVAKSMTGLDSAVVLKHVEGLVEEGLKAALSRPLMVRAIAKKLLSL